MNVLLGIFGALSRFSAAVGRWMVFGCMATMSIVVCMQVFARYVLNNPIHWSEELARFVMIWLGLVGASVVLKSDGHVAITVVRDRLHPKAALVLKLLGRAAMGVFLAVVIKEGIGLALFFASQKSPAMRLSMAVPYLSIIVAGAFMALHLVYLTLNDIVESSEGKGPET